MVLEISGAHSVLCSALAKSSPAKTFWSVDAALEYLDGNTTILKSGPGVFDTGTTLFGLATGKLLRDL